MHPIFVSFTTAPFTISLLCDLADQALDNLSLRATGALCMAVAAVLTPFTALFGWFFWMSDDNGVGRMEIHMWLGTSLAVAFVVLGLWRWMFHRRKVAANWGYLSVAIVVFGAMLYQAKLGGEQSFNSMMGMVTPARSSPARLAAGRRVKNDGGLASIGGAT